MLAKDPPTVRAIISCILWGLFIVLATHDLLVAWATNEEGVVNKGLVTGITALTSFVAKDILEFVIKLMDQLKEDPLSVLRDFLNYIKPGKKGDD